MKRFHVHLHVNDLAQSIGFYSKLFATDPSRKESDYAKWMLQDPPVNFAISTRGNKPGIDHLGIQVDNEAELAELKAHAASADMAMRDEGTTTCCYARSDKHWVTDPQGIAWEHFQTLERIAVFNMPSQPPAAVAATGSAVGCCTPEAKAAASVAERAGCCPEVSQGQTQKAGACC
jgi:hypothetical protein